jgi:DNA (cytosine-5)-methyltransferase 1
MTHGSLFSGIGGFDLAAQWMGWENIFHCEWNKFGQKVLKYHFPKSISYNDITKTDFTIHRGSIDILTGGFPCQPYSTAGKRKGKEDERHLWPSMLRAVREIQPGYVVGENVRGLVNWSNGLVFHEVQVDLEAEGYEVLPFLLPACAVNAPHRRDRIWFIAKRFTPNTNTTRCENRNKQHRGQPTPNGEGKRCTCGYCIGVDQSNVADTDSKRYEKQHDSEISNKTEQLSRSNIEGSRERSFKHTNGIGQEWGVYENKSEITNGQQLSKSNSWDNKTTYWENFPSQSPLCFGDDGLSSRLDNITFSKWRNESIKAAGNAIVPQVVLPIFKAIQEYESLINKNPNNVKN